MGKPKIAIYWCASCGGCEEAVVDLAEDILKVVNEVEFVLWPVALDFKIKDIESLNDKEIAVSFINGAIRTEEQERISKLLRRKSNIVVAFGSCAHIGGTPGLANFTNRKEIFDWVYINTPSVNNEDKILPISNINMPEGELELPEFYDMVFTLNQVVDVDYYIPGCAPPPDIILNAVNSILSNKLPPKGSVLAPDKALCESCKRKDSKPDVSLIKEIKRVHQISIDDNVCFINQGIICLGPATRDGCGQRCINANMPCRGCFGPVSKVMDQGAKFLSALASILDVKQEEDAKRVIDNIVDPAGIFYYYSLPSSMLRRKRLS